MLYLSQCLDPQQQLSLVLHEILQSIRRFAYTTLITSGQTDADN